MKVLVLAPPMGGVGGVQQYTATMVRALGEILSEKNVRIVAVPAEVKAKRDGTFALSQATKLRFFARAAKETLIWRPDLIICTHLGVAPAAQKIESGSKIPYWIVLHGIEVWGNISAAKLCALQRAQRLIANSRFTLEATTSRHKLFSKESSVLPPSFQEADVSKPSKNADEARKKPPTVLTVGRLAVAERYKGHDVMLDAWVDVRRTIPGVTYMIVGDGDDRQRLEARARELRISDSVTFAGTMSGVELHRMYESCDVFALPARTDLDPRAPRGEGFGIVFLEAMSHEKPVLGPKVGAPSEFIRDGEHGILVDPTNVKEISEALISLLQQPEKAERMGRAAKEFAQKEFSFEKFRERLKNILAAQGKKNGGG